MRILNPSEVKIEIKISYEDLPIRGNLIVSGDDAYDKEYEDCVIADLENGNIFAWCCATVVARFGGLEGSDHLGGGNCKDEKDFREMVMEHGMIENAVEDLIKTIRSYGWDIEVPRQAAEAIADRCKNSEIKEVYPRI